MSIDDSLSHRPLTPWDQSIITSSTALFALFLSPFSSVLADRLGRKRVILVADILFALGALVQALASHVSTMVLGRSVVGAAVGAASFIVPLYIAELAPAASRGRLVTMNALFVTLGQVVAYISGWAFAEHGDRHTSWRWMVGLGALPALLQLALLLFMPETPRWLVKAGRSQDARAVVAQLTGQGPGAGPLVEATVRSIELEIRQEDEARRLRGHGSHAGPRRSHGWRELVAVRRNRRALLIACLLQGLQQLCGFNSLMYFAGTIFALLGFSTPTLTALVVAVTNFAFTVAALVVVDRVGRRRVLLGSIPFMVLGLLLTAYGFSFIQLPSSSHVTIAAVSKPTSQSAANIVLLSIMMYVASYAIGLGNVPWMQSELFALNVRSLGSGLATATNWGANFVVGLTFLLLMDALSPTWTFVLYAGVCVGGYALIWRYYPETSRLSLEQAANLLEHDDWGVRSTP